MTGGADFSRGPDTDPLSLYRYRDGLYAVDLLTAAIVHLDFFTWLAKNPSTREQICSALRIAARPTDVMLTLFAANGFVARADGVYRATPMARDFLAADSQWFMGPYYASLKDRPIALDFLEILRTDKPANWGSFRDEQEWQKAMQNEAFARRFTAAMDCRGVLLGRVLAEKIDCSGFSHLLDVAGGSGIYACAFVARYDRLQATVFERAPVDQIASRLIRERGYADRVGVKTGDMFEGQFPPGCDIHLYSNVLHDWDEPKVKMLLAHSFRALRAGGMLIVHDMHLHAEKNGPLPVAEYSCLLMHSTEGRCYSVAEIDGWLREIGFADVNYASTTADRSVITARKH